MNGDNNCVQNLCLFDKLYVDLFVEIAKIKRLLIMRLKILRLFQNTFTIC